MDEKHSFEVDLSKHGDNGFKRLDEKGRESIRGLEIPTCSKRVERMKKLIDKKPRKSCH